jgi:uncharacterized protein YllA (UPF0747 family)
MTYLRTLGDLYRRCDVQQPRLVPRMSVTLVEPWSLRQLHKLGLSAEAAVGMTVSQAKGTLVSRQEGFNLKEIEQKAEALSQEYVNRMAALHPDFTVLRHALRQETKLVMGSIRKNSRERNAGDLERLDKLFVRLRPFEKPQERVFNLFYYMNLYGGLDFVGDLLKRYDPEASFLEVL